MNCSPLRTLLVLAFFVVPAHAFAQEKLEYNRDIRPILTDACFRCHGPAARKGGFRLDLREEATRPAKSKATPIIPGKPQLSELITRIFSTAEDEMMPPPASHK